MGVLTALAIVPFLIRKHGGGSGTVTMVASGFGFAATNVATKLLSDDLGLGHYWNAAAWTAVALGDGIAATLTGMTAFQRARATVVVPVTTAIQSFLPIAIEPLFLREQWSSATGGGVLLLAGVLTSIAGTVTIARTPGVGEVAASATTRERPRASGNPAVRWSGAHIQGNAPGRRDSR
jgi:hypothetical protein